MKIGDVSISTLIFVYTHKYIRSTIVCETEYLTKKLILKVSKYIYIYMNYPLYACVIRYLRDAKRGKRRKKNVLTIRVYFFNLLQLSSADATIDATTDRRPPIIYNQYSHIVVKNPFLSRIHDSTLFRSHRNNRFFDVDFPE